VIAMTFSTWIVAVLQETVTVEVSFLPDEPKEYKTTVPLYLESGIVGRPYLLFDVVGTGLFPQLSFDRKETLLPPVPLGVQSRAVFHVINTGYDYLELRHRIPVDATASQVPLKLHFPEGSTTSLAKSVLPVEVQFTSKRPVAFTANIEFMDDSGGYFVMPVSGISDNSLLTTYPFIDGHRSDYVISASPKSGVCSLVFCFLLFLFIWPSIRRVVSL
jgi:hypothetical protein